jgi:hypothetical protein
MKVGDLVRQKYIMWFRHRKGCTQDPVIVLETKNDGNMFKVIFTRTGRTKWCCEENYEVINED